MPSLYNYRIFIRHAWKYGADYQRLVDLLDVALLFNYINYSAPSERPLVLSNARAPRAEVEKKISSKIALAQVVLVISGMYTNHSDWMKFEIDEAHRMGKPIIAIQPWGGTRMPEYVQLRATACVGWNTNTIVSAIRNHVK